MSTPDPVCTVFVKWLSIQFLPSRYLSILVLIVSSFSHNSCSGLVFGDRSIFNYESRSSVLLLFSPFLLHFYCRERNRLSTAWKHGWGHIISLESAVDGERISTKSLLFKVRLVIIIAIQSERCFLFYTVGIWQLTMQCPLLGRKGFQVWES